jgi:hypothetical protein
MKKSLFYLTTIALSVTLSAAVFAQVNVQPSAWYTVAGPANLGVVSEPKPLQNFLGTKATGFFSGYTGASVAGIPTIGAMLTFPVPVWQGGTFNLGLAGGWTQNQKLAGRIVFNFSIPIDSR